MSPRLLVVCALFVVAVFLETADSQCTGDECPQTVGCFKDKKYFRALPHWKGKVANVQECVDKCLVKNYKFAGVQNGNGCRCGTHYAKYGPATNCDQKCESGQICGGYNANSVYHAGTGKKSHHILAFLKKSKAELEKQLGPKKTLALKKALVEKIKNEIMKKSGGISKIKDDILREAKKGILKKLGPEGKKKFEHLLVKFGPKEIEKILEKLISKDGVKALKMLMKDGSKIIMKEGTQMIVSAI